jgi:tetratricopeptide (TPR) repeat protein
MSIRCKAVISGALLALSSNVVAPAQMERAGSHKSMLQQHYEAAERYQTAHDPDRAAYEYRIFLTDALGELAISRALAGQYERAAASFDEALTFAPHSTQLQVEYAQAALQNGDLSRAKTLAEQAIREAPRNARARLILGRTFLKENLSRDARRELDQAVAIDPTFVNGYALAVACLNLEDQPCAARIFSEMTSSFGDTSLIHMYFGQAYLNSDFQGQAIVEFQKAIAKNDRLPGAHYLLAAAYYATTADRKLADIETELKKEIAISPKSALAYAALGRLELGKQKYGEAEGHLRRAVELDANNQEAFLYLGQLYVDMKQPKEAEGALRSSIRLTTDVSNNRYDVQRAHYLLGRLLIQSGDVDDGKKELQTSEALTEASLSRDRDRLADYLNLEKSTAADSGSGIPAAETSETVRQIDMKAVRQADAFEKEVGPPVADSYNNLGAIAGSEKNYGTALIYFQRATEWNPALEGLDENWGRAAFAAGQFLQAIPPLKRYLRSHPENKDMCLAFGISQFMVGDYAGARSTLQPFATDSGAAPQVRVAYAESLVKTGDVRDGVERLIAIEQIDPNSPTVHRALGEALALNSDTERAAQELDTAIRIDPKDAASYDALGRLQLAQGNITAAILSLEQAVKLAAQSGALHHDLAIAYRQASRTAEAEREMRQYEELSVAKTP